MDNALTGAIISGAASIVAALISKADHGKSSDAGVHSPGTKASFQLWITACSVIGTWSLASPAGIHTVLAHYNFALVSLAVMALAWFRPIRPMIAASAMLGLFAVNWVGWRMAHSVTAPGLQAKRTHLQMYLLLAFASTLLVLVLSMWRSKAAEAQPVLSARPPAPAITGTHGIATELERLAQLHRSGVLSDDEFSRGKEVILGHPRRVVARRSVQMAS